MKEVRVRKRDDGRDRVDRWEETQKEIEMVSERMRKK